MKPSLVIVGLGNVGASYTATRHNAGFWALDALSESYGTEPWADKQKFLAQVQEARIVTVPVLLVKPTTLMNLSGNCVRKIVDFYRLDPMQQVIVVSDDIDLPLGDVRIRHSGGPGTHNGLKSVCDQLGNEYTRIRIGLGDHPKGEDLANWVLSVPPVGDRKKIDEAIGGIAGMVEEYVMEEK